MKKNRNDKLKSLIQQNGLDKPMPDFMEMVMLDVSADRLDQAATNSGLKSLLQQHGMEYLPADFTDSVLLEVHDLEKKIIFKPIISLKTGLLITLSVAIILFFVMAQDKPADPLKYDQTYAGIQMLNTLLKQIHMNGSSSVYLLVLIVMSALLASDYILRYHLFPKKPGTLR